VSYFKTCHGLHSFNYLLLNTVSGAVAFLLLFNGLLDKFFVRKQMDCRWLTDSSFANQQNNILPFYAVFNALSVCNVFEEFARIDCPLSLRWIILLIVVAGILLCKWRINWFRQMWLRPYRNRVTVFVRSTWLRIIDFVALDWRERVEKIAWKITNTSASLLRYWLLLFA
jgi:hypothetical protein